MGAYEDELQPKVELIASNLNWLQEAAARWRTYYTGTITLEIVVYWLLQFDKYHTTKSALELIKHINFVDTNRLVALLQKAWQALPERVRNEAFVAPIGSSYDSSSIVGYSFAKNLGLSESELTQRWVDIKSIRPEWATTPIVLIDDNLTSGTQLTRFFSEIFPEFTEKREHFLEPLTIEQIETLKGTTVYIVVALELSNGRDEVIKHLTELGFKVEILSGAKELTEWLEFGGPIWASEEEAAYIKTVFGEIGAALLEDKSWGEEIKKDRALGYGSLQRLTVFAHNVPKSLITALWKYGKIGGKPWLPLFPERKEWALYESEIRNLIPELKFISDLICSGAYGKAAPACSAFINIEGEPTLSVKAPWPSDKAMDGILSYIFQNDSKLEHMALRPEGQFRTGISPMDVFGPSNEQIKEYNLKVDVYNEQRPKIKESVIKVLQRVATFIDLPLRVYNDGTSPATDVVLMLELSENVQFSEKLPPLPKMPTPPIKPSGDRLANIAGLMDIVNHNHLPEPVPSKDIRLVKDRGKTYIQVFFGRILQRTFRDRNIRFILVPHESKVSLPFEIIYHEANRPIEGTFLVETVPASNLGMPPFIWEEWFDDNPRKLLPFITN